MTAENKNIPPQIDKVTQQMEKLKNNSQKLSIIVVGTAAVSCIAGTIICNYGK